VLRRPHPDSLLSRVWLPPPGLLALRRPCPDSLLSRARLPPLGLLGLLLRVWLFPLVGLLPPGSLLLRRLPPLVEPLLPWRVGAQRASG
jgi:hypothetical protein